jgi:hypothetical protein
VLAAPTLVAPAAEATLLGATTSTAAQAPSPVPGFLLERGRFTPVAIPRGLEQLAPDGINPVGINDRGQIVGVYSDPENLSGSQPTDAASMSMPAGWLMAPAACCGMDRPLLAAKQPRRTTTPTTSVTNRSAAPRDGRIRHRGPRRTSTARRTSSRQAMGP